MQSLFKMSAGAATFAVVALASTAIAAPHSGYSHMSMPSHGFHSTPPSFHGSITHLGHTPSMRFFHGQYGHSGHDLGSYHGHDFGHFTADERDHWQHGEWRHSWHNGHYGWWWFVGGDWFFYPGPIYPYPEYVGPDYWYDYEDEYGPPSYYWYYCEDPAGYYPYVQQCNGPWQPVPPDGQ